MTVQWRDITLPLVGGLDTKADERALQPPKLALLENGVFTKRGSIRKRNGYAQLGNETIAETEQDVASQDGSAGGARALLAHSDELLLADQHNLYSYVEQQDGWADRGQLESVSVGYGPLAKVPGEQTLADRATAGGIAVTAWEDSRGGVRYSIADQETGATHIADQSLSSTATRPRCITVGSVVLLFYVETDTNEVRVRRISPADIYGSIAAPASVVATLYSSSAAYDAAAYGSSALVCWHTDTDENAVIEVSASGSTVGSQTLVAGLGADRLSLATFESSNYAVTVVYAPSLFLYVPSLGVSLGVAAPGVARETAVWTSADTVEMFWEEAASPARNSVVRAVTADVSNNTLGSTKTIRHSALASKAWADDGRAYVHVVHESTLQTTYFVVESEALRVVARVFPGLAGGVPSKAHLPAVEDLGERVYSWAAIHRERLDATGNNAVFADKGARQVTYAFADAGSHRAAQLGGSTYISGGVLWMYDGDSPVESGFLLYPENCSSSASSSTGSLTPSKSYNYRGYYEWTSSSGERERSAQPVVVTQATGVGEDTVTLVMPSLAHTGKQSPRRDIAIVWYRQEADAEDDAPYYRVTSPDPTATGMNGYVENDPTADTVSFIDGLSDTDLITKELDYQNTGEIENTAPPAARILCEGKGRLFLSGTEWPNRVSYSKVRAEGEPVAFNDALYFDVPDDGGEVTALAVLDANLVVFKRSRVYIVNGDGVDNFGQGEFSPAQLVSSDCGCENQPSIANIPAGLMFQSAKGIYLLDRGLQLSYIGADVELYNSQTVTAATVIPDRSQVRFLTDEGKALVYDYLFGQWSTFTAHEGVAACTSRGVYHYARANARVLVERDDDFRDVSSAYRLRWETAWIGLGDLQGYQRIKSVWVLGEYRSSHTARLQVAYDYDRSFVGTYEWDPTGIVNESTWGSGTWGDDSWGGSGSSVYQFRADMTRQKCQAIKLRYEDVPGSPAGESAILTGLRLRVGTKATGAKLPANRIVGGT
jgi:hypothetical protein